MEYVLELAQVPNLFVIRKQLRKGLDASTLCPLAYYYILDK